MLQDIGFVSRRPLDDCGAAPLITFPQLQRAGGSWYRRRRRRVGPRCWGAMRRGPPGIRDAVMGISGPCSSQSGL